MRGLTRVVGSLSGPDGACVLTFIGRVDRESYLLPTISRYNSACMHVGKASGQTKDERGIGIF